MYDFTVLSFIRGLEALLGQFDKAAQHADRKKFDTSVYLGSRLAPDMYPFVKQVQVATDMAKGTVARLAGQTPPVYEDNEKNLDELRARVKKTVEYLKTFKPAQFEGAGTRKVELPWQKGKYMLGPDYAAHMGVPNFYFHLTTAYALLRHNGVDVGKTDFVGKVELHDL